MKGYSLIEVIIVIALIAIFSLFGSIKFNQFREDTVINLATEEFESHVRSARAKSMVGEIREGETVALFEENGLPSWGVSASVNTYSIFREFILKGEPDKTRETIETITLDSSFNISGDTEVLFPRISGQSSATFIIEKVDTALKREVSINLQGVITIKTI